MQTINPDKLNFYEFLNGDLSLELFETYVFRSKTLEIKLSADDYFYLIEFNFRSPDFRSFVKSIVKKYYDWIEYEKWRTVLLLERVKNGDIEIVLATRMMMQLYLEQESENLVPHLSKELAIGYESLLDTCPVESEYHLWKPEALEKQLEPVQLNRTRILEGVEKELNELLSTFNEID